MLHMFVSRLSLILRVSRRNVGSIWSVYRASIRDWATSKRCETELWMISCRSATGTVLELRAAHSMGDFEALLAVLMPVSLPEKARHASICAKFGLLVFCYAK